MTLASYDGFSVDLPEGWEEIDDDASYSDPTEGDRKMFGRPGHGGVLCIPVLPIDPEGPPSASAEHVESLALAWGRARGLSAPASISTLGLRDAQARPAPQTPRSTLGRRDAQARPAPQ